MKSQLIINPEAGTIDRLMPWGELRHDVGFDNGSGHRRTTINRVKYYNHRLIWEHVHGAIPDGFQVDHINGDSCDNRIENLRLVTPSENTQNQHRARTDNLTTKVKGVTKRSDCNRFRAQIGYEGRTRHIGTFKTIEEAQAAYAEAAANHHTHNPHASPCPN